MASKSTCKVYLIKSCTIFAVEQKLYITLSHVTRTPTCYFDNLIRNESISIRRASW